MADDADSTSTSTSNIHTVAAGVKPVVAHPAIQDVLLWVARNNHRATGLLMDFVAAWCAHRRENDRPLPMFDMNILAAITKFVSSPGKDKKSATFGTEQDMVEMVAIKTRLLAVVDPGTLPEKLFSSVVQHSAQQVRVALDNNIVSQFKTTVTNVLKIYVARRLLATEAKAINKLVFDTMAHLVASDVDYDDGKWMPVDTRLWVVVRGEPWVAALRQVAQTCTKYSDDKPMAYYLTSKPQAYLRVMMDMNDLIDRAAIVGIASQQLFPCQTSSIVDMCRIDYFGLRDILIHACPDVLPHSGPDAACRNPKATLTPTMREFVWAAAFRLDSKLFRPARSKHKWHVFGASIQTDGISLRVQRVESETKPTCVTLPPRSLMLYARVNTTGMAVTKLSKQDVATRDALQAQYLMDNLPPLPDGITGQTCPKTRAEDFAKSWRLRAKAYDAGHPESVRSLLVEARWLEIRDEASAIFDAAKAAKALCPEWDTAASDDFSLVEVKAVVRAWTTKLHKSGADAAGRLQLGLWKARLKVLEKATTTTTSAKKRIKSPATIRTSKRAKQKVDGEELGVGAATREFQYVDELELSEDNLSDGLRLVGVDPNKGTLMQCCEVPDWVSDPDACGHKRPTTWFRHTQNERRFETKVKYLATQREELIRAAKVTSGVDVKAAEAGLRLVNSRSVTVAGLDAYLEAKHRARAIVRPIYEDPAFLRLRWQGFRAKQRADTNLVRRFREKFGPPETTAICWGDWSERGRDGTKTHMRFHESTRGVGLRRLFQKNGYRVWMVDEDFTSKRCHGCQAGDCATFRSVPNPRPHRVARTPRVLRWGLVRCGHCHRLWDRDRNSALNILWIAARRVIHGLGRPPCLSRGTG